MRFTDVIKVKRTRQSRSVRSPCNPRRRSCRPRCIERLEPRLLLSADLFISEFVASNDRTLMDSDGDWPDWLEIHNPTEAPVSLFGWSLTDNDGELDKWRFPYVVIQPDEYLVVFASGKNRADDSVSLRRDFHATADGTFLVDLPEGVYDVRVTMGDVNRVRDNMAIYLQGEPISTITVPAGKFTIETYRGVEVNATTSGRLSLRLEDIGGETGRAVINALIITRAGDDNPTMLFDFGEASSPVEQDFTVVTETDRYSADTGFGWMDGGGVVDRDRGGVRDELHTNFKLSAGGEYLGLVRPDMTVVHGYGPTYPPQFRDVSYGLPQEGTEPAFLATPTPGEPNSGARGALVQFDRPGGAFSEPFLLGLSVNEPGALIHFTTDGTDPTEQSTMYTGPVLIAATTRVRAIAVAPGLSASSVTSRSFVTLDPELGGFTSDLPIVVLENFDNGRPAEDGFQFNFFSIYEPDEVTGRTTLQGDPGFETRAGLRVRGSSTRLREKASFTVETWDEHDRDKETSPLGLPENSDWVLYAPYNYDLTMLRNSFMYELSNQMGRYAVRTRFVELFHNVDGGDLSVDDYRGVYLLMERITRGTDRVDVTELQPQDDSEREITGGWILKNDRAGPDDRGITTSTGVRIQYVDPKEEDVTSEQATWIQDYFNEMFASLADPDPVTGYAQYIDVDSWIDHHILNVLTANPDALRFSDYFFKDRGGKFEMGPIWDFDRSMESTDGRDNDPTRWQGGGNSALFFEYDDRHPWWGKLFEDPNFMQRWIDRWFEWRQNVLSEENIASIINTMADEIAESQVRNFERWSAAGVESPIKPRSIASYRSGKLDGTWRGEVEHMKAWLVERLSWIDSQFIAAPAIDPGVERIPLGQRITLTAADGTSLYTTDGEDPRLPGGEVRPDAITYNPSLIFVDGTSAASYLVPAGDPTETNWQEVDFDDANWTIGQAAVGFDTGAVDGPIEVGSGFTVQQAHSSGQIGGLVSATALLDGTTVASETVVTDVPVINYVAGSNDGHFDSSQAFPDGGGEDFALRATATLVVRVEGTYTFGTSADEGSQLRIDGANVIVDQGLHLPRDAFGTLFLTAGTHNLELVTFNRLGGAAIELFYARGSHSKFDPNFVLLGGNTPFTSLIQSDVQTAMHDVNSTLYQRIPFSASGLAEIERLALRMQYDDGFVAYLNGVEVARRNAPAALDFDSTAPEVRADVDAVRSEKIDITPFRDVLREGDNLLAIHILNVSADSPDLLLLPVLEASVPGAPLIFSEPFSIRARTFLEGEWGAITESNFVVAQAGDMNLDGKVGLEDIDGFVSAMKGSAYDASRGVSIKLLGDTDGDGDMDFDDIAGFVALVTGSPFVAGESWHAQPVVRAGSLDGLVRSLQDRAAFRTSARFAADMDRDGDVDFDDIRAGVAFERLWAMVADDPLAAEEIGLRKSARGMRVP